VEEASENGDWDVFREKLVSAQSPNKQGKLGKGPRYAIYDFQYELASGDGTRYVPKLDTGSTEFTQVQKQDHLHRMVA